MGMFQACKTKKTSMLIFFYNLFAVYKSEALPTRHEHWYIIEVFFFVFCFGGEVELKMPSHYTLVVTVVTTCVVIPLETSLLFSWIFQGWELLVLRCWTLSIKLQGTRQKRKRSRHSMRRSWPQNERLYEKAQVLPMYWCQSQSTYVRGTPNYSGRLRLLRLVAVAAE